MRRISNFEQFVNEGYLDKSIAKISGWVESFKNMVKSGLMRIIPSGPKAGKPVAVLFDPDKGSIEAQLLDHFKGTEYGAETANEARVPMEFPKRQDVLDVNVNELKSLIKTRLKKVLQEGKDGNSEGPASGKAPQGVLDVKPIFIYGAPGIGKTQIVAQVADELGKEMYGKPLNFFNVDGEFAEPVDFGGVPSVIDIEEPSKESPYGRGITRSNVSINLLPQDNGKDDMGGILFIDELNRMPQEVIKIFMKLIQSRRLGATYTVPSKWYIVAAGNRPEDDPREIKPLGTALRDRFSVVNYVASPKSYRAHIETSRYKDIVLPELLDFLDFQSDYFHNLDPAKPMTKYPTPRAWTDASVGLKMAMEELKSQGVKQMSERDIINTLQLEVGFEAANAFMDFYRVAKEIPVKDLLLPFTNPEKAPLPDKKDDKGKKRADYAHALLAAIIRKSKELELDKTHVCNFAKYLERVGSPEWGNAAISNLFKTNPDLARDPKNIQCVAPLADKWGADLGTEI